MSIDIPADIVSIMSQAKFHTQDYLAVAAAYMRRIGLAAIIDGMAPSQMGVSPGTVVTAMILDTLSGRTPLYRLSETMQGMDLELYLGKSIQAEELNDSCLGRALDTLYEAGSAHVMMAVSERAVTEFKIPVNVGHYDTTSTSVWGEYRMCEEGPPAEGPRITYGYSKDLRPDMRQFVTECLCVGGGIPLLGKTRDGNASDKVLNNELLSSLSAAIPRYGINFEEFVYVADSAAVTEENLKKASACGFISRLPFTYKECEQVIRTAVEAGKWLEIGALTEREDPAGRKPARYKTAEGTVCLYEQTWRAIVVHSTAYDKRRTKGLEKKLTTSRATLEKRLKPQPMTFHCRPDAEAAMRTIMTMKTALHRVECTVTETTKRGRGRPAADGSSPTRICYELSAQIIENTPQVEQLRAEAGCFVLITNLKETGAKNAMSGKAVLSTYKEQSAVEMNFGFLKDPLIVNDLFLKKPKRVEALGLILLLALLVWRLMERSMRQYVLKNETTLPGWDGKRTDKPTAFMMSTKVTGVQVIKLADGTRHVLKPLNDIQLEYLHALGVTLEVFTKPLSVCSTEIAPRYPKRE